MLIWSYGGRGVLGWQFERQGNLGVWQSVASSSSSLEARAFCYELLGSSSSSTISRDFEQARAQAQPFQEISSKLELELDLSKYFELDGCWKLTEEFQVLSLFIGGE